MAAERERAERDDRDPVRCSETGFGNSLRHCGRHRDGPPESACRACSGVSYRSSGRVVYSRRASRAREPSAGSRVEVQRMSRSAPGCESGNDRAVVVAGARESPRPDHGRDGHGQDGLAADARGAVVANRRAGLHGRRQRRSLRARRRGRQQREGQRSAPARSASSFATRRAPSCSGMSSANAAIRFARRSPTWGRCCSRACCS